MRLDQKRILVTGAGGFIGGRVAEVLSIGNLAPVRGAVRRWSTAARIGRLQIELVQCDIRDRSQIAAAMDGASAVVHCAVGDRATTVEGTANLLEAAKQAGVERVIHLSTVDVYGRQEGDIDEVQSWQYTGDAYGDAKIDAEKECLRYVELGVPIIMLRPTVVYGPFSTYWTVALMARLASGRWRLFRRAERGVCNLVYIDDLVEAIRLALTTERGIGEAFNISGPEPMSWNQYFQRLSSALNLGRLEYAQWPAEYLLPLLLRPVRGGARYALREHGTTVMKAYERFALAKRTMKWAERLIRNTPSQAELALYTRDATYNWSKARRLLGYEPVFNVDGGLHMTKLWLECYGYLDN